MNFFEAFRKVRAGVDSALPLASNRIALLGWRPDRCITVGSGGHCAYVSHDGAEPRPLIVSDQLFRDDWVVIGSWTPSEEWSYVQPISSVLVTGGCSFRDNFTEPPTRDTGRSPCLATEWSELHQRVSDFLKYYDLDMPEILDSFGDYADDTPISPQQERAVKNLRLALARAARLM